jgi:hypothetical protein
MNPFVVGDRVRLVAKVGQFGTAHPQHFSATLTGRIGTITGVSQVSHATSNGGGYQCDVLIDGLDARDIETTWDLGPWRRPEFNVWTGFIEKLDEESD